MMTDQLEALLATKDAPNLYWALTDLPNPMIDLYPTIEVELSFFDLWFPQFAEVRQLPHNSPRWAELTATVLQRWNAINDEVLDINTGEPRSSHGCRFPGPSLRLASGCWRWDIPTRRSRP